MKVEEDEGWKGPTYSIFLDSKVVVFVIFSLHLLRFFVLVFV